MVKRYPHTISFESTAITKGSGGFYTEGETTSFESKGRYENHSGGFTLSIDGKRLKVTNWILCPLFDDVVSNNMVVIAKDESDNELFKGEIIVANKLQTHYEIYCK